MKIRFGLAMVVVVLLGLTAVAWAREYQYGEVMGQYKGVEARCNGAPVGNEGTKYSCVSYVRSLYRWVYHLELGSVGGSAKNAFSSSYWGGRSDFEAYPQGSKTLPRPDDILCFSGGRNGHVAIITAVRDDSLDVIEQNVSLSTCYGRIGMEYRNGYHLANHVGLPVQGWLHYKKVATTQSSLAGYDDWRPQAIARENVVEDVFLGAGKAIAFCSNRGGSNALYTYETGTGKLAKIADLAGFRDSFAFSGGGSRVLLARSDGTIVVLTIEAQTKKVRTSTLDLKSGGTLFPTWTSDKSFLFENSQGQIMQAELVEKQPADVAEEADRLDTGLGDLLRTAHRAGLIKDQEPRLIAKVSKPEATRFLSAKRDASGFDQLCIVGQSGKALNWLTQGRFSSTLPVTGKTGMISLAGANGTIAFCSNRSGNWDIYRAELGEKALSGTKRLTTAKADEVQPAWAFNIGQIYYTSDSGGHSRIYAMDADGRNQRIVMR